MRSRAGAGIEEVFTECLAARGVALEQLTARTAWEAFADFARLPFGASEAPDGDALLYQWGTFITTGRPQFCLVLSRQVALEAVEVVGMGRAARTTTVYEQFDCRLRYPPDPALTALGRFASSWLQGSDSVLTDWVAQIDERSEWSIFESLRPAAVEITSERV